jgi:dolichyl-phosphate-mannose--protein O-mannosyl transferase
MMARFFEYLHSRRVAVKWLFFALLVIIPLCDLFVEQHEVHFIGNRIYFFWSLFGLVICLGMIVIWKWMAHSWLERDEDYYDK